MSHARPRHPEAGSWLEGYPDNGAHTVHSGGQMEPIDELDRFDPADEPPHDMHEVESIAPIELPDRISMLLQEHPELFLSGHEDISAFDGVVITETEGNLSFSVPPRFINAGNNGIWKLEVSGTRQWLKERDNYGEIRFLADDSGAIWVPHLFPFEEVDDNGLPTILDRERCKVTITLDPLTSRPPQLLPDISLATGTGSFSAVEAIEYHNPEGTVYFTEFCADTQPLRALRVSYPDNPWDSFSDYLAHVAPDQDVEMLLFNGLHGRSEEVVAYAREFYRLRQPHPWYHWDPSEYTGSAFGSIWVPVDELRKGVAATITFPCFQ